MAGSPPAPIVAPIIYMTTTLGGIDILETRGGTGTNPEQEPLFGSSDIDVKFQDKGFTPPQDFVELTYPTDDPEGINTNYKLTGETNEHPKEYNHWGTQDLRDNLIIISDIFNQTYAGVVIDGETIPENIRLRLNDMSLPNGGVFDISGQWVTPHITHREGRNCDISYDVNYGADVIIENWFDNYGTWADFWYMLIANDFTVIEEQNVVFDPSWHYHVTY